MSEFLCQSTSSDVGVHVRASVAVLSLQKKTSKRDKDFEMRLGINMACIMKVNDGPVQRCADAVR